MKFKKILRTIKMLLKFRFYVFIFLFTFTLTSMFLHYHKQYDPEHNLMVKFIKYKKNRDEWTRNTGLF